MPCFTGNNAGLFIRAETGPTPTTKVGTEWTKVIDVTDTLDDTLAQIKSRAKRFASNCPTVANFTVDINANYERGDAILGILRTALFNGTFIDASILDSKGASYAGYVGRFAVQSINESQPLEEGQTVAVVLAINDGPTYITA
jgi:hypothetical protein